MIALFGPTGVGKTDVAVALARRLRAQGEAPVAVSADALQVYAGLETLTGAAGPTQRGELEHRLLSFLPVDATFSAGQYAELAHAEIDGILADGGRPIVVGRHRPVSAGRTDRTQPPAPARGGAARAMVRGACGRAAGRAARRAGPPGALGRRGDRTHRPPADRAGAGAVDSGELEPAPGGESELWTSDTRHPTLLIGLVMERSELYAQIGRRVDAMLAAGVEQEVRAAQAAGASDTARKALGFAELLAGDVEGMKRRTRNYARRQLTWMRKLGGAIVIDRTQRDAEAVAAEVLERWTGARPSGPSRAAAG